MRAPKGKAHKGYRVLVETLAPTVDDPYATYTINLICDTVPDISPESVAVQGYLLSYHDGETVAKIEQTCIFPWARVVQVEVTVWTR